MSNRSQCTQSNCMEPAKLRRRGICRQTLAVLAFFFMSAALAPQAMAQACGGQITLLANQWRMVGIPCVPLTANQTIDKVFGPSLGSADYGVTWIAWRRVYDSTQCNVSSGPSDCYIKLTLASPATVGDAFWIYTTQEKRLQFSSTSSATPGPYFQFTAKLSTNGNSRYYMFANPYAATVNGADLLFPTHLLTIYPVIATAEEAVLGSVLSKEVYYWNGNTYFTRALPSPEDPNPINPATIAAKQAVWFEMLQPISVVTPPVEIRIPKP